MSYTNPLHSSVGISQKSNFSSLRSALNSPTSSNNEPSQRRMVPQTTYAPFGKWRSQVGDVQPLQNAITFDFIGFPDQGMPLKELCIRGPYAMTEMMRGANNQVLAHTELRKITLHIRWPGYEHIEWIRSIDVVTASGPITQGQLAHAVAQNFVRYIEKVRYEVPPTACSKSWRLGSPYIILDHIVLHSLHNVFEDAWQAKVSVSFRWRSICPA